MPGTTALTYSNEQLSVNLSNQVKEARAMNHRKYPVVADVMKATDKETGGERIIVRWETDDHSEPTRVQTGYEYWNDAVQTTLTPGHETWGIVVQPVMISEVDEQKNSGPAKVLDLLKIRTGNVERHMHRNFQDVILRGAAASGTWTGVPAFADFNSLNGADITTGLLEASASGTNTIHNVSKASFPATTHPQFHNEYSDAAGAAGTNILNALYGFIVNLMVKDGEMSPAEYIGYFSPNSLKWLKRVLRAQEQYVAEGEMDDGKRTAMVYHGIRLKPVHNLPQTGANTTANPVSGYIVNWQRGIRFRAQNKWVFNWTKFMDIPGTVGVRAAILRLWGNLIGHQVGLCALLADAEAY